MLTCQRRCRMSIFRRLLAFIILGGAFLFVQPQSAFARVVSCESLELDPRAGNNRRILESYYNLSAGNDDVSCWFYPHPNGEGDGVVMPANWSASPTLFRRNVITQIFYAISRAREKFEDLGMLNNKLLFALHDERLTDGEDGYDAEVWPLKSGSGECWIDFGGVANRQLWTTDDEGEPYARSGGRATIRFVAAHEIAHCFQEENIIAGSDPLNSWWIEGTAENYAAVVFPRLNDEHPNARAYDLNKEFTQDAHITYGNAYSTHVLFAHYATKFGIENIVPLANDLNRHRSNLKRYFRDNDLDEFFHDFSTTHYFREIVDTGGGHMPRQETVSTQYEFVFEHDDVDEEEKIIPKVEHSKLVLLDVRVPKKHKLIIYPIDIDEKIFQSIELDGVFVKEWNSEKEVEGDCENDRVIGKIFLSHTNDNDLRDVPFRYSLELDSNCMECTVDNTRFKRLKKYGPDGKYGINGKLGSPEWLAEHPQTAPSIYNGRCKYQCVCENRSMWKDTQVTEGECNSYFPNGNYVRPELAALNAEQGTDIPTTLCESIRSEYETKNEVMSSSEVLKTHCTVKCGKEHGNQAVQKILRPTDAIKESFEPPIELSQ